MGTQEYRELSQQPHSHTQRHWIDFKDTGLTLKTQAKLSHLFPFPLHGMPTLHLVPMIHPYDPEALRVFYILILLYC